MVIIACWSPDVYKCSQGEKRGQRSDTLGIRLSLRRRNSKDKFLRYVYGVSSSSESESLRRIIIIMMRSNLERTDMINKKTFK